MAITVVVVLGCLAGGVFWWSRQSDSPEQRAYDQLVRELNWSIRARILRWKTPANVAAVIPFDRIESALDSRHDALVDELVGMGFLTNAVIPIPGLPPGTTNERVIMDEVQRRLTNRPAPATSFLTYWVSQTNLKITCRTSDLPVVRAAVNSP
jgi:hypothetical protein